MDLEGLTYAGDSADPDTFFKPKSSTANKQESNIRISKTESKRQQLQAYQRIISSIEK